MKYSGRLPTRNVNVTDQSPLKEFFTLFSGLLVLIMAIYFLLGVALDKAVQYLTPEQENAISFSMLNDYRQDEVKSEKSVYLQSMMDRLTQQCVQLPYEVTIFLVDREEFNAIALPGGKILVFSGLLKKIKSENELAFVLGHELGHLKNKDHLKGMGRGLVLFVLSTVIMGSDNTVGKILQNLLAFPESNFSHKQESMADVVGLKVLQCRYGHVSGATRFFRTMLKEDQSSLLDHFFSSHPETKQRIDSIHKLTESFSFGQGELEPLDYVLEN